MMKQDVKLQPTYFATIPADVRYANIKANCKLMYGEITCLSNKLGYCFATNNYFAELYGVSKNTISVWINDLVRAGFIETEIIRNEDKSVRERRICINKNDVRGITENREGINTSIKNTSINNINNRQDKFVENVFQVTDVSIDVLKEFCDYWTERNPKGTKMRFEMERTFDINLRLKRWCRNNKNWNQNSKAKSKIEETISTHQKAQNLMQNINNGSI